VQPAVVDALGDLLGGIRETLAATRFNPLPDLGPAVALNRSGDVVLEQTLLMDAAPPSPDERRVDELFDV
jgi:hypothetical protein